MVAGIVLVAGPLLALGVVSARPLALVLVGAAVLAAAAGLPRLRREPALAVHLGFALMLCLELLQVVPLGGSLLQRLAPVSAAVRGGQGPISLDVSGTWFSIGTVCTVWAAFAFVSAAVRRFGRRLSLRVVGLGLSVFVIVAFAQTALGMDRILGLHAPAYADPHRLLIFPTVLNANHAAAVFTAASGVLALAALEGSPSRRLGFGSLAAASAVAVLLTASRWGVITLAVQSVGLLMILRPSSRRAILALIALAVIGVGIVLTMPQEARKELLSRDLGKLNLVTASWKLALKVGPLGVGAGGFGGAFGPYQPAVQSGVRHHHAEHWPSELIVAHGWLGATLLVVVFAGAVVWALFGRHGDRAQRGSAVVLGCLLVHDLFDFALSFAGCGIVAAMLLAVVATTAGTEGRDVSAGTAARWWRHGVRSVGLGLSIALAVFVWRGGAETAEDEIERVGQALLERRLDCDEARRAAERRPGEWYLAFAAGACDLRRGDSAGWLLRAIDLGPAQALPRFWLGRWMLVRGRHAQAWAEMRTALSKDTRLFPEIAAEMIRFRAAVDELLVTARTPEELELAYRLLSDGGRAEDARRVDEYLLGRFPGCSGADARRIRRLVQEGKAELAIATAESWTREHPERPDAWLVAAEVTVGEGGEELLAKGLQHHPTDVDLLLRLLERRGTRLGLGAVVAEHELLLGEAKLKGRLRDVHLTVARVELARKAYRAAVDAFETAFAASGKIEDLIAAAETAEKAGLLGDAETLYERLEASEPGRFAEALRRVKALRRP